ncbi:MAG: hypothetical protein Fur007_07670 [Rhodoferax sp.]
MLHDAGGSAADWQDLIWRLESNGWPREQLLALNQPDPWPLDAATAAQPGRSTPTQRLAYLKQMLADIAARRSESSIVLIGQGQGARTIEAYLGQPGAAPKVTQALLIGGDVAASAAAVPAKAAAPASAPANASESAPQAAVTHLPAVARWDDAAFATVWTALTGAPPLWRSIWPEFDQVVSGTVLGLAAEPAPRPGTTGAPVVNNRPLAGATLRVYPVDAATGLRTGGLVFEARTDGQGRFGPWHARQGQAYEWVVQASGYAVTHVYRSPMPRGSDSLVLQAQRIADDALRAHSIVFVQRPGQAQGASGDTDAELRLDGQAPAPHRLLLPKAPSRAVVAEALAPQQERVVGRTLPAKDNHVTVLQFNQ